MPNTVKESSTRKKSVSAPAIPPNDIASRAFELFSARGGAHGYDVEDWLRAERELISASAAPKKRVTRRTPAA